MPVSNLQDTFRNRPLSLWRIWPLLLASGQTGEMETVVGSGDIILVNVIGLRLVTDDTSADGISAHMEVDENANEALPVFVPGNIISPDAIISNDAVSEGSFAGDSIDSNAGTSAYVKTQHIEHEQCIDSHAVYAIAICSSSS